MSEMERRLSLDLRVSGFNSICDSTARATRGEAVLRAIQGHSHFLAHAAGDENHLRRECCSCGLSSSELPLMRIQLH